jgi:hypothetical protein
MGGVEKSKAELHGGGKGRDVVVVYTLLLPKLFILSIPVLRELGYIALFAAPSLVYLALESQKSSAKSLEVEVTISYKRHYNILTKNIPSIQLN